MADALLSALLTQMVSTIGELAGNQLKLVAGVEEEIENLKRNMEAIKMVVKDAEKRQWKDEAVKLWMEDLKDVSYDIDLLLDHWNTAIIISQPLPKVRCSAIVGCFNAGPLNRVRRRLSLAREIETLNGKLDNIARRKDMFNFSITADGPMARMVSTSIVDVSKVYGQDEYKKILKDRLLCGPPSGVEVVVGMGGIGKTTLAKIVYNDDEVKSRFGKRLWVCVSDPFDIVKIANEIVEQLTGRAPAVVGLESVMQNLIALIRDDRFLLVLDDVWTEDYEKWELLEKPLLSSPGSSSGVRIVVTTRKVEVARMMGIRDESMVRMRELSEKDCWSLFREIAFFGRKREDVEDLEEIGREIAIKCNGFPLAAKALGSLLRVKRTKAEWIEALRSEIWRLEKIRVSLFHPLLLSYLDLSPAEKRCLSYCAMFPKGHVIGKKVLIYMWMALGYFGPDKYEDSERCFESLAALSFFQDLKYLWGGNVYVCKMHDIVHDFVRFLTLDEHSSLVVAAANNQEKIELSTRHLTVLAPFEDRGTRIVSPLLSISCRKNLQSLMVLGHPIADKSVIDWCSRFASLRTFILETSERMSVPESLGALVHLRYLALISSKNDANESRIPRTLGNLCNLQSLILKGFSLPEEVSKLVNLRYLSCMSQSDSQFTVLPKGVVRLSKLMNLNARLCHDNSKEKFELGDLSQLNDLRELRLQDLGIGKNHAEGAKRSQLSQRTSLRSLDLFFANKDSETHESVLEALRPPPSLTFLAIKEYGGSFLSPTWMSSSSSSTLRNLKFLGLFSFPNCETLPPLGKLESLETLIIRDMGSLAKVGPEFLGDDDRNITLFPKLKSLEFSSMPLWIEWDGFEESDTNIRIMPCLEKLEFHRCEALKALPEFLETTPVTELVITASSELESSCRDHRVWSLIASRSNALSL